MIATWSPSWTTAKADEDTARAEAIKAHRTRWENLPASVAKADARRALYARWKAGVSA